MILTQNYQRNLRIYDQKTNARQDAEPLIAGKYILRTSAIAVLGLNEIAFEHGLSVDGFFLSEVGFVKQKGSGIHDQASVASTMC